MKTFHYNILKIFCISSLFWCFVFLAQAEEGTGAVLTTETGANVQTSSGGSVQEEIMLNEEEETGSGEAASGSGGITQSGDTVTDFNDESENQSGTGETVTESGTTVTTSTGSTSSGSGTLGSGNEDPSEEVSSSGSTLSILNGHLQINEVMVNPLEGKEWIELRNTGTGEIFLQGVSIADETKTRYVFEEFETLAGSGFLVLEFYNVWNNGGDTVTLTDSGGTIIDQVAYGHTEDYIATVEKDESFGRSVSDSEQWKIFPAAFVTRGARNYQKPTREEFLAEHPLNFRLNEIFANADGADEGKEWIELYRTSSGTMDLAEYVLEINEIKTIDLAQDASFGTGAFLILNPLDYNITLRNTSGSVAIKSKNYPENLDYFFYAQAKEEQSWQRDDTGENWIEKKPPSPLQPNQTQNHPPQAQITVQGTGKTSGREELSVNVTAENSFDPDGDDFTCFWNFGDGKTSDSCNPTYHKYFSGIFTLSLTLTDQYGLSGMQSLPITVLPKTGSTNQGSNLKAVPISTVNLDCAQFVSITEFLPNPEGADAESEWIELYNVGTEDVNLAGCFLDDMKGGSKAYQFPANTWIKAKNYKLFQSQETKLALNNTGDSVRLLDSNSQVKQQVSFGKAPEGKSWQKISSEQWVWLAPTPRQNNTEMLVDFSQIKVVLQTVLPNPSGQDSDKEWFEIKNESSFNLNLKNWSVQTLHKKVNFETDLFLAPGETRKFFADQLNLTLTNNYEELSLFTPLGDLADRLIWREALSGKLYKHQIDLSTHVEDSVRVIRVIDGDTIEVNFNGQKEKVRFIGVDTPETVHPYKTVAYYGAQASAFTRRNLLGKMVVLKYDQTKRDKYGRILAYVYLENGNLFNEALIKNGYAWAYLRFPFQYSELFALLETEAREQQKGMWKQAVLMQEIQVEALLTEEEELESEMERLKQEEEILEEALPEENTAQEFAVNFQEFDFSLIRINEFYPNTIEGDRANEWIELYNSGTKTYDLQGWQIDDTFSGGSRPFLLSGSTLIPAHGFLVIRSDTSGLALNNSTDTVNLINPYGILQDSQSYIKTQKGCSWARNLKGRFVQTCFKTPGQTNLIRPQILKTDQDQDGLIDQDELDFYQTNPTKPDTDGDQIPDGFEVYNGLNPLIPETDKAFYTDYLTKITTAELQNASDRENVFLITGKTEPGAWVRFFVHSKLITGMVRADANGEWSYLLDSDLEEGEHTLETELISATGLHTQRQTVSHFELTENYQPPQYSNQIKIESLMPNPKGKDVGQEFFTLSNPTDQAIDLHNWSIVNQKNKVYLFPSKTWLPAQSTRKFYTQNLPFTLHNTSGFLVLKNPYQKTVDRLAYSDVQEDEIFTHVGGNKTKTLSSKTNQKRIVALPPESVILEPWNFRGEVISKVNPQTDSFVFRTQTGKELEVIYDASKIPALLAESLFQKGNALLITGEFTPNTTKTVFVMQDFTLLYQTAWQPLQFSNLSNIQKNYAILFFLLGFLLELIVFLNLKLRKIQV